MDKSFNLTVLVKVGLYTFYFRFIAACSPEVTGRKFAKYQLEQFLKVQEMALLVPLHILTGIASMQKFSSMLQLESYFFSLLAVSPI